MSRGPGFRLTRDDWLERVQEDGLLLERVPPRDRDKQMVLAAVSENGFAIRFSPEPLKRDREIVSAALQENGLALCSLPDLLKDDEHVVLEAVQSDGLALRYASPRLKAHHAIVFPALQQNLSAFDLISNTEDPAIVLHVLERDGRFYSHIMNEQFQRAPAMGTAAVTQNGLVLQHLPLELRMDRKIVLAAVSQNGRAWDAVPPPLRDVSLLLLASARGYDPTPEEYVTGVAYARQLILVMEEVGRGPSLQSAAKQSRVDACFHSLSRLGPEALRETKTQMAQLLGLDVKAYPHAAAFIAKYNAVKIMWPPDIRAQVERQLMGRVEAERRAVADAAAAAEMQNGDPTVCSVMGGKKRQRHTLRRRSRSRRSRRSLL